MKILQALAISIPAWLFLFFLVYEGELYLNEWQDFFAFITISLLILLASFLAFTQCDIQIRLKGSREEAPSKISTRANIAYLLTGFSLGFFPVFLWGFTMALQRNEYAREARGVRVLIARRDIGPGSILHSYNIMEGRVLKENITGSHYDYKELEVLRGAEAVVEIPKGAPILYEMTEGKARPQRFQNREHLMLMQDLL